jgi:hypothetical protein
VCGQKMTQRRQPPPFFLLGKRDGRAWGR